jgi:hypothetical protein
MKSFAARLSVSLLTLAVFAICVAPADAQTVGLRGGLSVDPDQFYLGVHTEVDQVIDRFAFRPNLEVGFGDNATVAAINAEFLYPFQLDNGTNLYAGAGPAINIISFDVAGFSDTVVEPGLNFLFGVDFDSNYFAELKVGAIDSPDVKFGFGYTWRQD